MLFDLATYTKCGSKGVSMVFIITPFYSTHLPPVSPKSAQPSADTATHNTLRHAMGVGLAQSCIIIGWGSSGHVVKMVYSELLCISS